MKRIVPSLLVLTGLCAGGGVGLVLKPDQDEESVPCVSAAADCELESASVDHENRANVIAPQETDFANLNKQFVVPIVSDEKVVALVVASLSLEVKPGGSEIVYSREPKLRDEFLKVLFSHAHSGGFSGEFTSSHAMQDLRTRLNQVAKNIVGDALVNVLIVEIVRQDM
jgi:flagellar protein FliL